MLDNTKEFLSRLADLIEEYKIDLELEYDYGCSKLSLVNYNKESFDEFYDRWCLENPGKKYPFMNDEYVSADYIDMGYNLTPQSIRELLK